MMLNDINKQFVHACSMFTKLLSPNDFEEFLDFDAFTPLASTVNCVIFLGHSILADYWGFRVQANCI